MFLMGHPTNHQNSHRKYKKEAFKLKGKKIMGIIKQKADGRNIEKYKEMDFRILNIVRPKVDKTMVWLSSHPGHPSKKLK
jgi:proteasome lid subunit RPN8/RPN11